MKNFKFSLVLCVIAIFLASFVIGDLGARKMVGQTNLLQTPEMNKKTAQVLASNVRAFYVPILTYHYISENPNLRDTTRTALSVTPKNFDDQMAWLSRQGYTPITLDTLGTGLTQGNLPEKPVVLTFDDSYIDFYYNANQLTG